MWRDRWFVVGVVGAALACLACLTPIAVVVLGALGLAVWVGWVDVVVGLVLAAFVGLAVYRERVMRRRPL